MFTSIRLLTLALFLVAAFSGCYPTGDKESNSTVGPVGDASSLTQLEESSHPSCPDLRDQIDAGDTDKVKFFIRLCPQYCQRYEQHDQYAQEFQKYCVVGGLEEEMSREPVVETAQEPEPYPHSEVELLSPEKCAMVRDRIDAGARSGLETFQKRCSYYCDRYSSNMDQYEKEYKKYCLH